MKRTLALLTLVSLSAGIQAHAQTATTTGRSFGNGGLPEFLKPYDTDGNGVLSAEEREAARKGRADRATDALKKWDLNGDGKLSPDEIEAARKAAQSQVDDIRTARFTAADKDSDGFLTSEEFAASVPSAMPAAEVTKLFTFLDADKDGKISLAEFLAPCPKPPTPPELPPVVASAIPPLRPFGFVDTNADGIITPAEFSAYIKAIPVIDPNKKLPIPGGSLTDDQIAAMFAKLDTNSDNGITPDEWPIKDPLHPPVPPAPQALPAFATADKNADKSVTPDEFAAAACASHIPALVAREMFRAADANDDGKLTQAEYEAIPAPGTSSGTGTGTN